MRYGMNKKLALALASSTVLASAVSQAAEGPKSSSAPPPPPPIQASKMATLSKAELKKLLANIEKSKEPQAKMGAMCYSPAPASPDPEWLTYVCPVCGKKTYHTGNDILSWEYEITSCRRLFKELPHHEAMVLDESSFCKKCRSNKKKPALALQFHYDDGTTNTISGISSEDLRLLKGLFSGQLSHETPNEGTFPLKGELPRLHKLLGLKP